MYQQEYKQHMEIQDSFVGAQKRANQGSHLHTKSFYHDEPTEKNHHENSTFRHEPSTKGKMQGRKRQETRNFTRKIKRNSPKPLVQKIKMK